MVEVVVFGVNRFGGRIYDWLVEEDDTNVLALITDESQYDTVEKLDPELIVSAGFRHIVPEWVLYIPSRGAVNCHLAYLPHNRGMNPNVWSIVEGTPAGVSIHYMTPDIDAGPVISRSKVDKYPDDDGRDLYRRLERAMINLFVDTWPDIKDGEPTTTTQPEGTGTYHNQDEFHQICKIDLDETVQVGEFIDLLRALTFPPYDNAYIEHEGERYYLELSISRESDTDSGAAHWNMPEYEE